MIGPLNSIFCLYFLYKSQPIIYAQSYDEIINRPYGAFIEAGTVVPYLFAFVGHVVPGRTIATGRSNWMASSFEIDEPCVEECAYLLQL